MRQQSRLAPRRVSRSPRHRQQGQSLATQNTTGRHIADQEMQRVKKLIFDRDTISQSGNITELWEIFCYISSLMSRFSAKVRPTIWKLLLHCCVIFQPQRVAILAGSVFTHNLACSTSRVCFYLKKTNSFNSC